MPRIIGPKITCHFDRMGIADWRPTTVAGRKGFYEGVTRDDEATGIVVDRKGLVWRGRSQFPAGTFFFRGEPVEFGKALIGGEPKFQLTTVMSVNQSDQKVFLEMCRKNSFPRQMGAFVLVSEMLDRRNNPIFNASPADFSEEVQGMASIPFNALPDNAFSTFGHFLTQVFSKHPALKSTFRFPMINIRIGEGLEVGELIRPGSDCPVNDIRFIFGINQRGEYVGQLVFSNL